MLNLPSFKEFVYDWLTSIVDPTVTVIWENQAEHRPKKPYISLNIISGPVKRGQDDILIDDLGRTTVSGLREMTVSTNYFGENAVGELGIVQTSFELPSVIEEFADQNICLVMDGGIKNLTSLMENRFETRAQMDIRFRVTDMMTDQNSTWVETVEAESLDGVHITYNP